MTEAFTPHADGRPDGWAFVTDPVSILTSSMALQAHLHRFSPKALDPPTIAGTFSIWVRPSHASSGLPRSADVSFSSFRQLLLFPFSGAPALIIVDLHIGSA